MSCAKEARKLADYVISLPNALHFYEPSCRFSYYHIGALFTDIVLQAGLNYNSVVKPRIQKILTHYPDACTVSKFQIVVDNEGLGKVINWKHPEKIGRFEQLMEFARCNRIDTCVDLKLSLSNNKNRDSFLAIKGFGPKTLDYLLKLLNVDSVAVDRHIYAFVKMANIETSGYNETKKVVEYAADLLNISRTTIDHIIWKYMSEKKFTMLKDVSQTSFEFPEIGS